MLKQQVYLRSNYLASFNNITSVMQKQLSELVIDTHIGLIQKKQDP